VMETTQRRRVRHRRCPGKVGKTRRRRRWRRRTGSGSVTHLPGERRIHSRWRLVSNSGGRISE
jgi:hypothetical protein